ncbi:MAG: hypothetical protein EOP06_18610, partial [Proteobacteria bacterium]
MKKYLVRSVRLSSVILTASITFTSLFASASTDGIQPTDNDITELSMIANAVVPSGKFKGSPLNTAVRRPLYVLSAPHGDSDRLTQILERQTVTVGNYFHNGKFYVAELPTGKIASAIVLEAPFSAVAAHTMIRYEMEADAFVELVAVIEHRPGKQVRIVPLDKPILQKGIVMSIDGTEPLGQAGWNMKSAIAGHYTEAYRMVSVPERIGWFVMTGTPIHQIRLNLSADEAQQTLRLQIKESHKRGFLTMYDLLRSNCTNEAIRIIKNANPYRQRDPEIFPPTLQILRSHLNKVLQPLEPFTQFTKFNLRTLGWVDQKLIDLQTRVVLPLKDLKEV